MISEVVITLMMVIASLVAADKIRNSSLQSESSEKQDKSLFTN